MAGKRNHSRGYEYPHEGFVQLAIEKYFASQGFNNNTDGDADLICINPATNEQWLIEAKGLTSSVGLILEPVQVNSCKE